MQTTIYYQDRDEYLMDKVEEKANRERRSKSSVILSIVEHYFEAEKRIGEILHDLNAVSPDQIETALARQEAKEQEEKLGRILLDEGYVTEIDIDRALSIQDRAEEV